MSAKLITADVDLSQLDGDIRRLAAATGKGIHETGKAQVRLLMRDVINLTPPAGGGVTGIAAKKRGEAAITGDLFGGRQVDTGGFKVSTEGLFIVSKVNPHDAAGGYLAEFKSQNNKPTFRKKEPGEDEIASIFTNKKGQVYGVEKQLFRPNASVSEMLAHIARYRSKSTGRVSRAGLRDKVIGRHVFIDKMVISPSAKKTLLRHLHGHVGKLAANWLPASGKVNAPAPGWVKRHGSPRGAGKLSAPTSPDFIFEATNDLAFPPAAGTMRRRIQAAVRLRGNAIRRAIPNIVARRAKQSGFR